MKNEDENFQLFIYAIFIKKKLISKERLFAEFKKNNLFLWMDFFTISQHIHVIGDWKIVEIGG